MAVDDCFAFRDTYHDASINGVPFYATDLSDEFGRRGPTHEYPDKDTGAAEDLGRKQSRYNVSGWVAGNDHVAQARNLKNAAEAVSPARLVHPIWGTLLVKIDSMSITHNREAEQGVTHFSIQAVEFGGISLPSGFSLIGGIVDQVVGPFAGSLVDAIAQQGGLMSALNAPAATLAAAGDDTDLLDVFTDVFDVSGLTMNGIAQVDAELSSIAGEIYDIFLTNVEWNDTTPDVLDTLELAGTLPTRFRSPLGIVGLITTAISSMQENARSPSDIVDKLAELMIYGSGDVEATGPNSAQIAANINIMRSSLRAVATLYAVRAVADSVSDTISVQTSTDLKTITDEPARFSTSADVLAFMDIAVGVLDEEVAIAQVRCDDALLRSLRDITHSSIEELQKIAFDLPPRVVTDVCLPLPSLVSAYRSTGDARRVLQIECQNPGRSVWFMRDKIEHRGI